VTAKTILVDFDGVIHSYKSGWLGADQIPDAPVPGALDALRIYIEYGYDVCIYSSRSKDPKAVAAMHDWFVKHGFEWLFLEQLAFPTEKPPAWLTIDDRCFCFKGRFPSTSDIDSFIPWNQRGDRIVRRSVSFDTETSMLADQLSDGNLSRLIRKLIYREAMANDLPTPSSV
jgi:hypothetical protein